MEENNVLDGIEIQKKNNLIPIKIIPTGLFSIAAGPAFPVKETQ